MAFRAAIFVRSHKQRLEGRDHAGHDSRQARHIPQAARGGVLRDTKSLGHRQRAGAAGHGLQGARLHQRRLCLVDRQGRQSRHARRCLRASHRAVRRGRSARQCRLRGRLRARAGEGRGQRRARGQDRRGRAVDRGFHRRQGKAAVRPRASAIERIKAARAAIDADDSGVLLAGRCEGFLVGASRSRPW